MAEATYFRELIHTLCWECFIDVTAFPAERDPIDDEPIDYPILRVGVLSSHLDCERSSLRGRLRAMWQAWRGKPELAFSFGRADELARFVEVLQAAGEVAFPEGRSARGPSF